MASDVSELLKKNEAAHDAPMALMTASNTFTLPSSIGNLQSRETKTLQFVMQFEERPEPTGVLLKF